jgi:hypothetical protein
VHLTGIEGFDTSLLQELEGVSRTEWDGEKLVVYGGGALLPRVIVALDHHGITPSGVTVGRRTLEDVFVEKTGRGIRD